MVASARELPPRVLVVRLGAIGDVVNALSFAGAIRTATPPVEVGWVVHPEARPLVEGHPWIDRVHVWERGQGLGELWRLARELRACGYGLAIDLQRIAKSALLARLSGAARTLGYDRGRSKEWSWLLHRERIPAGSPASPMLDQALEFARALGLDDPDPLQKLSVPAEDDAWAEALVAELGAPPLLVNLGATKPANRWEPERFGHLARALIERFQLPVCLTGGPGDRKVADHALAAATGAEGVRDLVGHTSLRQLVALEARARLWIGCDTGPMHIAVACGTPVVALFGPADPRRTGPRGQLEGVVRTVPPCAPCGRRTCNQPRHACMEDLSVELVLEAVERRLKGS